MDEFLLRAGLAGVAIALVAGPLGSFVVWRRMAYFGDTLAHSSLLGVAIGFALGFNLDLGIVAVCVLVACGLIALQEQRLLASDTLLGILSHGALAIGLLVISFQETLRVDLTSYLFGDVLAVRAADILWIVGMAAAALILLVVLWRPLLAVTVHEELARVEGVPVALVRIALMLLLALVIAASFRVVGILLITSLLIIPAASARRLARSPEEMAVCAALLGAIAVLAGLGASLVFDSPAGPSVVAASLCLFAVSLALGTLIRR